MPQPLNDVWSADVAPKETSSSDKMAEFDGKNDIIVIDLPSWCSTAALSLTHTHTHTHTHTLSLALSLSHTHSLSDTHTLSKT